MGLRIIGTGGRDLQWNQAYFDFLDNLHAKYGIVEVIEGSQMGADQTTKLWALSRGVDIAEFPYNDKHGASGGPRRNARMLNYLLSSDVYKKEHRIAVVAFKGNTGTADMVARAQKAQVKIIHFRGTLKSHE